MTTTTPIFKTSSFKCGNGTCVGVAQLPGGNVLVQDTKDTAQAPLRFTKAEWTAFIQGAKAGEFDV